MNCPKCGDKGIVYSKKTRDNYAARRRKCRNCDYRFITYELYEDDVDFIEEIDKPIGLTIYEGIH